MFTETERGECPNCGVERMTDGLCLRCYQTPCYCEFRGGNWKHPGNVCGRIDWDTQIVNVIPKPEAK